MCVVYMDGCRVPVRQFGCAPMESKRAHGAYTEAGRRRFQFARAEAGVKAEKTEGGGAQINRVLCVGLMADSRM